MLWKVNPMRLHRFAGASAGLLAALTAAFALSQTSAWAANAATNTVVVGTGNPDVDIPAVQSAVDRGGEVTLEGRFSFDRPPTVPTPLVPATILVSTAVVISGARHASIEAGTIPFYVEAPGASVTIQTLHFVRPKNSAILVDAVSGLTIASCQIEGIVPVPPRPSSGLWISTMGSAIPFPNQPGHPEKISGRLVIANNDIDTGGGTAADNVLGITVFSVGQSPDKQVDIYVSGNEIKNITEPAINFRRVGGRAHIEDNVITTGTLLGTAARPEAIRVVNIGSYVIARNSVDCQWPDPSAIGIGVWSQSADWPVEGAVVVDNEVTISPPDGTVFGDLSAGIDIRGFVHDSFVANNRIRGRARAALALDVFDGGVPANNAFDLNRFDHFEASRADVFVDVGVTDTLILGQKGTVEDNGVNTVIVHFHRRPRE
jgi:hypothetical protein